MKQNKKLKPIKWGFKFWFPSDSKTGLDMYMSWICIFRMQKIQNITWERVLY